MRINPSTPSATKSIFYDFIRKKYEIKEKFIPPKENELKKKMNVIYKVPGSDLNTLFLR